MNSGISPGLVEQVTTLTGGFGLSLGAQLGAMNKQRRVRRMRRVVIEGAEGARDAVGGYFGAQALLVTLTYRPSEHWQPEHISRYVEAVSRFAKRSGIRYRYQWVIELTKAGVPHYHVLWWVPHGTRLPMPDRSGMWTHGMSQIARARNAVGYLVKYATKGTTDVYELPKRCRLFGVGGGDKSEKLACHRAGLPIWLLDRLPNDARARKVARVGWVCLSTGEVHKSPYKLRWFRDGWGIVVIQIIREVEAYGVESFDQERSLRDQVRDVPQRLCVLH